MDDQLKSEYLISYAIIISLAGPLGNFSMFSDLSKIFLSFAMLIGRLEIFPILIFIAPLIQVHKKEDLMINWRDFSPFFHKNIL